MSLCGPQLVSSEVASVASAVCRPRPAQASSAGLSVPSPVLERDLISVKRDRISDKRDLTHNSSVKRNLVSVKRDQLRVKRDLVSVKRDQLRVITNHVITP